MSVTETSGPVAPKMATKSIKVLLQTTIPAPTNDWGIERFDLLRQFLASAKDETGQPVGQPLFEVTARNRQNDATGNDPVLSTLDRSDFDEIWLFAVDTGSGISQQECQAISAFRERGGGIMLTRDHMDLGSSLNGITGVGAAQYFHTKNMDPDTSRHQIDDTDTSAILWPNYYSGRNGDYQKISSVEPVHPLLKKPDGSLIKLFPAHPHEGGVGAPPDDKAARVVATGTSKRTGHTFNLMVAFDHETDDQGHLLGRAVADASFHHFADYNWDIDRGCPSFVTEVPGDAVKQNPQGLDDIKTYVRNLALWLAE